MLSDGHHDADFEQALCIIHALTNGAADQMRPILHGRPQTLAACTASFLFYNFVWMGESLRTTQGNPAED